MAYLLLRRSTAKHFINQLRKPFLPAIHLSSTGSVSSENQSKKINHSHLESRL